MCFLLPSQPNTAAKEITDRGWQPADFNLLLNYLIENQSIDRCDEDLI